MNGFPDTFPPEIEAIYDAVCDDDRRWFESHPNARRRVRPHVLGEGWPVFLGDETCVTIVTWIAPGVRAREHRRRWDGIASAIGAERQS